MCATFVIGLAPTLSEDYFPRNKKKKRKKRRKKRKKNRITLRLDRKMCDSVGTQYLDQHEGYLISPLSVFTIDCCDFCSDKWRSRVHSVQHTSQCEGDTSMSEKHSREHPLEANRRCVPEACSIIYKLILFCLCIEYPILQTCKS